LKKLRKEEAGPHKNKKKNKKSKDGHSRMSNISESESEGSVL
jgi:hypothetical protein